MKHLSLTVLKLMPPIAVAIPFSIKKNKKKKNFYYSISHRKWLGSAEFRLATEMMLYIEINLIQNA